MVHCPPRRVVLRARQCPGRADPHPERPIPLRLPPSNTGAILNFTGRGLAILSWGAVLVLLLASFAVYGYRIRVEEKVLVEKFEEDYIAYLNATKVLVPGVV